MNQELKKIRTPLIIASSVTIIALIYFGYQQFRLSSQLDEFAKLYHADNAFFDTEFEKAFDLYEKIDDNLLPDSMLKKRKNLKQKIMSGGLELDAESKNELINFLLNCKTEEDFESLTNLENTELIKMLKTCYGQAKEEKMSYKNKAKELGKLNYLRINTDKNIHYFGETKDLMANGYGIGIWENQSSYEGMWKNNLRHGKGVFTTEKGEVYEGEYVEGRRNGFGVYTFRNGDFYTGEWKDGGRSGFGTVIDAKGDTIVHGFWENDRFDRRRTRRELND